MTPSLKISEKLINRLSTQRAENSGDLAKIYGIVAEKDLYILGTQLDIEGAKFELINSLPAEVDLCGILNFGGENINEEAIIKQLNQIDVTDTPVFINYNSEANKIDVNFYANDAFEKSKYVVIDEQAILSRFLHLRLQAEVPLTCELSANGIKEAFVKIRKNVASGIMSFGFTKFDLFILGSNNENAVVGANNLLTIGELCDEINEPSEGTNKKKKTQHNLDVLNVKMFKKVTWECGSERSQTHAPLCVLGKKNFQTLNVTLPIDSLAMVHRDKAITELYEILVESAIRNLKLHETCLVDRIEVISPPETFHFYPQICGHFFTQVYITNDSEESLVLWRENLHKMMLLPLFHPLFRRANAFAFKSNLISSGPLTNPHEGLKPTDNGGRIALVKGKYLYYHYGQDKMDDNGWGCAYRSLQTLASWMKLQGYTNREVPNFKDIQKCLVDIGDKPKNFISSKQWIGSTEVSFVLNSLLGVTCKILHVSNGEEMAGKGPELVNHFEHQGSPVMIGGGVLAHTILGVDYNNQSGSLKFLILDPHYTGNEDLHTIQSKGWCGWKGVDFWDKTSYYNMCLPQVPIGV